MDLPPVPWDRRRALACCSNGDGLCRWRVAHVTTSEVSTLKHEFRDDTMELAARVAEALLAGAEGTEVLGGLWDGLVEELEIDAGRTLCCDPW